ncbi:MMPL family protein [Pirellulimonas nuda]|uniref:MMPL family protein n=2 Tax=Pirellulimonas nuda TaxID=2528009 RepID=A0A518DJI2_9BACT|nr:MMPL family protein [Pirellulimonas nuda]
MIAYAILAIPMIVVGAVWALDAQNSSPIDWVPESFPPRAEYDSFCEQFGRGDVVVMSWPGCSVDEPRIDQLTSALRATPGVYDPHGGSLLSGVASGREALTLLTTPLGGSVYTGDAGPALDRAQAIRRLQGSLIGPDGQTTLVTATLTGRGLEQRERVVELLRQAATDACGVPDDQLRVAGPVVEAMAIDAASQASLNYFAGPSSLVVFLLCWASLRSLRAAVVVFGLAGFCQAATMALVYYGGDSLTALLIVLPPLVQVLAVAGGVHLTNYYFDMQESLGDGDESHAARHAFHMGWAPCVLSAATTAIGMASLTASELAPIRAFGAYAAAGVLLTAAVMLGLLPAFYALWPPRRAAGRGYFGRSPAPGTFWPQWSDAIGYHSGALTVVGLALLVLGVVSASWVKTSVRIDTLFARDSQVMQDYAWIEQNVAPLLPIEVRVSLDRGSPMPDQQKLALLASIAEQTAADGRLGSAFSAADVLPDLGALQPDPNVDPHAAVAKLIAEARPRLEALGLLAVDPQQEHWRLTVRGSAIGDVNYAALVEAVRNGVATAMIAHASGDPASPASGLHAEVTGIMPLVQAIQTQLLDDLLKSFAGALIVIAIVMTLVQAGILSGLLAMIPNVFPIAVYFGWLGLRGAPIDIGVVMTASIALGIAIDDTLHFLTFFGRGLTRHGSRGAAVRFALSHCGPAMVQTTLSCGLGLLVFALSDFLPTARFAVSMAALLMLALLADLVLLPALLLSPLGVVASVGYERREPDDQAHV